MYAILAAMAVLLPSDEQFDRDALRTALPLPRFSVSLGLQCGAHGELFFDADAYFPDRISSAEQAVREQPGDPDRLHALSDLYAMRGDEEKSREANAKATALYRAKLATRPRDGLLLTRYTECLNWDDKPEEIEAALRRAVELSPGEWECWATLAKLLLGQSGAALGRDVKSGVEFVNAIRQRKEEGKISDARFAEVERLRDEAFRCLDRAVTAAPTEPRVYVLRWAMRTGSFPLQFTSFLRGGSLNIGSVFSVAGAINDIHKAAEVAPQDFRLGGAAAYFDVMRGALESKSDGNGAGPPTEPKGLEHISGLSPESRTSIRRTMESLRAVAHGNNLNDATEAAELLAIICLSSDEDSGAGECLEYVAQLKPSLNQIWDFRCALARMKNDKSRLASLCQEHLRYRDTAPVRLKLAKALEATDKPDEARSVLEEALRKEPDDLPCGAALATLLLRKDNLADQKRAGEILARAEASLEKRLKADPDSSDLDHQAMDLHLVRVVYLALAGQEDAVHAEMGWFDGDRSNDERFQKLREVLGPRLSLPAVPGVRLLPPRPIAN
jgi:tetratricopeptide (TPR) repeat protein